MKQNSSSDSICEMVPDMSEKSVLVSPCESMDEDQNSITEFAESFTSPNINQNVAAIVHLWGKVTPMAPYDFLAKLQSNRGYDGSFIPAPTKKRFELQ